ncbi:hypothetical protein FACS189499_10530 [Clostridia bacterium]|nr:hypothetical protein FACS189499_10530 [Clostridia bacterium]
MYNVEQVYIDKLNSGFLDQSETGITGKITLFPAKPTRLPTKILTYHVRGLLCQL